MATHSSLLAWRIPMDRGAWQATVRGVAESQTRLNDYAQHSKYMYIYVVYQDGDKSENAQSREGGCGLCMSGQ